MKQFPPLRAGTREHAFHPARVLAFSPHADDVTLFAGGTLALWAEAGSRITVVRVTQDEKDSFDPGVEKAIEKNGAQFEDAMRSLGVATCLSFGFRDCELMDVPYGVLRERCIRAVREFRPDVIVSFDPAENDDENPDHSRVAMAVADASWAAGYPNFHPEHAAMGLDIWLPLGNLYFTRHFVRGDMVVDISSAIDKKVVAALCHENMLCTLLKDQQRRIRAAGFDFPILSRPAESEYTGYWSAVIPASAMMAAEGTDYQFVERFRSTLLTEDDPLVRLLASSV